MIFKTIHFIQAIGISVEFCSHIARAFATSNGKTRKERASEALYKMGPPVKKIKYYIIFLKIYI